MARQSRASSLIAMFRRVLVLLDDAPLAERILPWVRRLLVPMGGDVRLLAVLEPASGVVAGGRTLAYAEQCETTARLTRLLALERLAERLRDDGLAATSEIRFGDVIVASLDVVQDWGADMIAVAEPRRRGWRRLLPSVVDEIIRQSPVPVLVAMRTGQRVA